MDYCLPSYYSLLITHCSLLTTHCSLLTPHYSLLTTHYSLLMQGEEATGMAQPHLEKRFGFVMVSTRVFINVHYDFELEPDILLAGASTTYY